MFFAFSKNASPVPTLLVSELNSRSTQLKAQALAGSFPDTLYLVTVQRNIPAFYYQIPCVALAWEREIKQTKEELLCLGAALGIPPERCLLVVQSGFFFPKTRLQHQLERQFKKPVRFVGLDERGWPLTPLELTPAKSAARRLAPSKCPKNPLKDRSFTQHAKIA